MPGSQTWESEDHVSDASVRAEEKSISDVDFGRNGWRLIVRPIVVFLTGGFAFLSPTQWNDRMTIPLDVILMFIQDASIITVELFALGIIIVGGTLTTVANVHYRGTPTLNQQTVDRLELEYWHTAPVFVLLRLATIFFAFTILFDTGPAWMLADPIVNIAWGALVITVALIIPIGAVLANLLAELGGFQLTGTLAQPVVRPAFKPPGQSALDSAVSRLGSFSIDYYLTQNVFDRSGYNKREVFVICTCFATASLGIVDAVAAILGLLYIPPVIMLLYTIVTPVVMAILVWIPPLSMVSNEYITESDPEPRFIGTVGEYLRFAFNEGASTVANGDPIPRAPFTGLIDGLKLAGTVVGSVLMMSMVVLLLEVYTPVFEYIAEPFVPLLSLLGIPDPKLVTIGVILSGAGFFIGSTLVVQADLATQVFALIVTGAQAIFLSASAPMMVDMLDDMPMWLRDLFLLLVMRTMLLIPIATALTHAVDMLGLIQLRPALDGWRVRIAVRNCTEVLPVPIGRFDQDWSL